MTTFDSKYTHNDYYIEIIYENNIFGVDVRRNGVEYIITRGKTDYDWNVNISDKYSDSFGGKLYDIITTVNAIIDIDIYKKNHI